VTKKQYNPLDKLNLGKSVAEALLDRPLESLDTLSAFDGAGIYAIYYKGSFQPYRRMAERNAKSADWPIYIGKAIPPGGRRGAMASSTVTGRYLWNRLKEHADSLRETSNLNVSDFECRYLAVEDIWIPLGETLLITRFKPLWNQLLDGFGNHDPGSGRYKGLSPLWDVLHPGRKWALKCRARPETPKDLAVRSRAFLKENQPSPDPHMNFAPPKG
jgi:hypothetical protein